MRALHFSMWSVFAHYMVPAPCRFQQKIKKRNRKPMAGSTNRRRSRGSGRVRVPVWVPRARRSTPSQGSLAIKDETVVLPLSFFMEPLRHAMAKAVRPPTASTRRRQHVVEMAMPMEVFYALLRPFENGELHGLEWTSSSKTGLKPTKTGPVNIYQYYLRRPSELNKMWDLASWDR